MAAKMIVFFSASVLLVQTIAAQCINPGFNVGPAVQTFGPAPCGANYGPLPLGPLNTNGGSFAVSSSSPIAPTGIQIISENAIEGPLLVKGQLPVMATVAVEGQLPTSGSAGTSYSCGNGNVGIENVNGFNNGLAAGQIAVGQLAAGPLAAGPYAAGPLAAGPYAAGPLAANSMLAGPRLNGPGCGSGLY